MRRRCGRRWIARIVIGAIGALWLGVFVARGRAQFKQDVIEWPTAQRLIYAHVRDSGVRLAVVNGWPQRQGALWQTRSPDESWSGIAVAFTPNPARPRFAGQMARRDILPGILYESGTGVTNAAGSIHNSRSFAPLPAVPVTVYAVTLAWPWLICATTLPAVGMLAPITWHVVVRRRRRLRGLCLNCGYDLRASGEVCPECGAPRI